MTVASTPRQDPQRDPQRRRERERGGFAALELAILMPFVIVLLLLIVGFGRASRGRQLVDQAAEAAARAGSLSYTPGAAAQAAQTAAAQTLTGGGLSCGSVAVTLDTSQFYAGGQVVATVRCTATLSGLAMSALPGHVTLTADSTSILGPYRQLAAGS